ncbi:MAG TPA: Nif3-like dinuclear metal center hexameric protein [Armatimonadota bacterium]|nr:Nif3-like dinuclear metal center hexameric protein [Armatimonadota bacterium]
MRVRDVLVHLEQLAPPALAESWDNVGLLVGEASQPVTSILVALDVTPAVLDQAQTQGAQLIVTHHPLIFSGLKRLTEDGGVASMLRRMIREGRSAIAMHTNLDAAPDGLNTYVAKLFGLNDIRPLIPTATRPLRKLVVYVPESHIDAVRSAMCAAGAGHIGHYADCTFGVPGTGTFRPEAGTHPFIGTTGELEHVREVRLETVVPQASLHDVLTAMLTSHPYEEVAYDIFPLEIPWPGAGLGRIGQLASPLPAQEFLTHIGSILQTDRLSFIGNPHQQVRTIALCTGAGGDFIAQAMHSGADLYVTGEVKHHQALLARQQGMAVIDAGHFPTERPAVNLIAEYLETHTREISIIRALEDDPLQLKQGI